MFNDGSMADPIFSPDGKFIWSGSEWIPAPPSQSQSANVNLHDSVIGGDVNIIQTGKDASLCESCRASNVKSFPCIICSRISCEICNSMSKLHEGLFERKFDDSDAQGPYCKECKIKLIQEVKRRLEEKKRIKEQQKLEQKRLMEARQRERNRILEDQRTARRNLNHIWEKEKKANIIRESIESENSTLIDLERQFKAEKRGLLLLRFWILFGVIFVVLSIFGNVDSTDYESDPQVTSCCLGVCMLYFGGLAWNEGWFIGIGGPVRKENIQEVKGKINNLHSELGGLGDAQNTQMRLSLESELEQLTKILQDGQIGQNSVSELDIFGELGLD
jgi:hypothetical protein